MRHLAVFDAAAGLGLSAAGMAVATAARVWAAATDGQTDVTSWVQTGGAVTAVGALAYVAKLLADGKLVSLPVDKLISEMSTANASLAVLAQASHEREDRAAAREDRLFSLIPGQGDRR